MDTSSCSTAKVSTVQKSCQESYSKQIPSWWRLVWCHERCHKQECEERRKSIGEDAKEAGADLICLKKASKFAMWLAQAQRPPFALLTDWREVKPSLQAASTQLPQNRPAFTIVLCELPRHYERASMWAQGLPPRADPVHICKDISMLKMFLADLVGRFLSSAALRSQMQPLPQQVHHKLPYTTHFGFGFADEKSASTPNQKGSQICVPLATAAPQWYGESPAGRTAMMMVPTNSLPITARAAVDTQKIPEIWRKQQTSMWPVAMAEVLSPVCGSQSPVQIEQLLREAMPDHYDD